MRLFITSFTLLSDLFVISIGDMNTDRIETYTVSFLVDDFEELILHLEEIKENKHFTVGFNNLKTEVQLIDYILRYKKQLKQKEIGERIKDIKNLYSEIINRKTKQKDNEELLIKHIDLSIILQKENKTLEHIKASFKEHHIKRMIPSSQKELLDKRDLMYAGSDNEYNISIIKKIVKQNKGKLKAKINFQKIIKKEILNKTPTNITQIILNKAIIKSNRKEPSKTIKAKSIIDKRLFSIKNKNFKNILKQFAIKTISNKSKIDIEVLERGLNIKFSKSGIHAAKKGFHTAPLGFTIINLDAKSYFTSIIINSKLSPINYKKKDFINTLTFIHSYRNNNKISNDMKSLVKSMLSNVTGLSNSSWSDMYDPEFYYTITINGQLYLYLLFCMLNDAGISFVPLMQNTDGITFIYKDDSLEILNDVISKWSNYTNIVLTKEFYRQILVKDVSNCVGVGIQKEVSKGALGKYDLENFDYMSFVENEILYVSKLSCTGIFKGAIPNNYSYSNMSIVPKAVMKYYFYDIDPIVTLNKERDIFLFLSYIDSNETLKVIDNSNVLDVYDKYIEGLSRYIVTIYGQPISRKNIINDEKLLFMNSTILTTILNDVESGKDINTYQLNFDYYRKQIYKVLNTLSPGSFSEQIKMF